MGYAGNYAAAGHEVAYIDNKKRYLFVDRSPGDWSHWSILYRAADDQTKRCTVRKLKYQYFKDVYDSKAEAVDALAGYVSSRGSRQSETASANWYAVIDGKEMSISAFIELVVKQRNETTPKEAREDSMGKKDALTELDKMLATAADNAVRLMRIENEIEAHKMNVASGLIGIGRCLNEVKEGGLVKHGDWTAWVEKHAQMNIRKAQRLMAVAAEVSATSSLARLPFTKIEALMELPADEREAFAAEHKAEDTSVRELREIISQKNKALDDAEAAQKAAKSEAESADKAKVYAEGKYNVLMKQMEVAEKSVDRLRTENETMRAKLALKEQADPRKAKEYNDAVEKRAQDLANEIANAAMEDACEKMSDEIEAVKADYEKRIALLQAEADENAQAAQDARRAALEMGSTAPSEDGWKLTPERLREAAAEFLGKAGVLPHMGGEIAGLPRSSRDAYGQIIAMVEGWAAASRQALEQKEVIYSD